MSANVCPVASSLGKVIFLNLKIICSNKKNPIKNRVKTVVGVVGRPAFHPAQLPHG